MKYKQPLTIIVLLICTWTEKTKKRFPSKGRLLRSDSCNDCAAGYFLDYSM